MHRICRLVVVSLLVSLLSPVAALGIDAGLPMRTRGQLKFAQMTHNFGSVTRGQKLEAEFEFENVGDGPIVLHGIHAACGCTAVETENGATYEPGDRGKLRVILDTSDFSGKLSKSITVMSNEVAVPARTLTLIATVVSEVAVNPPLIDFGDVKAGSAANVSVKLSSDKLALSLSQPQFNSRIMEAKLRQTGEDWYLDVNLKPELPTGFIKETILVPTNARMQKEIKIPIRGNMIGPISHSPGYVEFGAISQQQTSNRTIALKAATEFNLRDAKLELFLNGQKLEDPERFLKLRIEDLKSSQKKVEIVLTNDNGQAGSVHGRLVLSTTEQYQTNLTVDFYAFFL
jgi:hypothetical protein